MYRQLRVDCANETLERLCNGTSDRFLSEQLTILFLVPLIEAATNELLLAGAAIASLFGIEARIKRTRTQRVLHEWRAIAHVMDMHQLTKDATRAIGVSSGTTESSPKRTMTAIQLTRHLEYCLELLSIVAKLAALSAQNSSGQRGRSGSQRYRKPHHQAQPENLAENRAVGCVEKRPNVSVRYAARLCRDKRCVSTIRGDHKTPARQMRSRESLTTLC